MVKIKSQYLSQSKKKLRTAGLILGTAFTLGFVACGNVDRGPQYKTIKKTNPTQGVITEVKEMEPNKFLITNETLVPKNEDSRLIAEYMDGTRDTMTMAEAQMVDEEKPERRRGMGGIFFLGMWGNMGGRSAAAASGVARGGGINSSAYASKAAYQKSAKTSSQIRSSATKSTRPGSSSSSSKKSSGFGSSKSSRSYGG